MKNYINVGSDFSGVGAFDQALIRLGISYKTVFACDMDKFARQTYIHNYGEPDYFPENVYDREIPSDPLDLYVTTPPCQSFSLSGKRLGEDDKRGILFYNSHEFIRENKPRYFIFENVKGLLSDDSGKTFQRWLDFLGGKSVNGNPVIFPHEDSVPYHIYWNVMNAKDYNVPQNRERVFIVGIRDDGYIGFNWPKPEPLTKRLKDILEDNVDEKYFLSEKMLTFLFNHTEKQKEKGNGFNFKPKNNDDDILNTVTSRMAKMGVDDNYIKVKSNTKKGYNTAHPGDSINFSIPNSRTRRGRVGKEVLQTIDTACSQGTIDGYRIRKITPREAFRGMDFPDRFMDNINFYNSINDQGIILFLENKTNLKWNVKEKIVKGKSLQKDIASCIIRDLENTEMQILSLSILTEKIKSAKLKAALQMYSQETFAQSTITQIESGEIRYLVKNNKLKSQKEQGKELSIQGENQGLEEKGSLCIDYYLRLSLEESLKEVNTSIILTMIQTITAYLIYIYSIPKESTICVILNYKNYQKTFWKGELLALKMGGTILSDTQLYKQAGNSVVVKMFELILKGLKL